MISRKWWKASVVYEIYWKSFFDSNGDGIGDLQGIIAKLDYIQSLGVDIIWVTPFNESPDVDHGYDISNYYTVSEKSGTIEDFTHLLQDVHRRGMKLIMDLVINHTSDSHSWFVESRSSRDNPKRNWYVWKEPVNGEKPNNWRSYVEPTVWEYDSLTNQYYMHSFDKHQPDLNWSNVEVREAIYEMMRFWLDQGIDGFRMDVINLLAKPEDFPNAEDPEIFSYLSNNPGIHEYLQEMNEKVLRHYDIMTVGEIGFVTPETGLKYVDESRNELNTLFHFQVADDMPTWDMLRYKKIQKEWYEVLKGCGWNSQFLNNHDHTRQVSRYGNDQKYREYSAKLLAAMIHTLPGTPYIYQGEEIGMTGINYPSIDDYRDSAMKLKYEEEIAKGKDPQEVFKCLQPLSRDNSRTPMQWNCEENAGFTTGSPWIKVNPNYHEINVENALNNPDSIYYFYQKLIELRKSNDVIIYGDYEDLSEGEPYLYAYTRTLDDILIFVLLNHSDESREFNLPERIHSRPKKLLIANYSNVEEESLKNIQMRPHEARIYKIIHL